VALVRTDVSEEILVTLIMDTINSLRTSIYTGVTRRNIPEDGILQETSCMLRIPKLHILLSISRLLNLLSELSTTTSSLLILHCVVALVRRVRLP
jgi:hypothetical protein